MNKSDEASPHRRAQKAAIRAKNKLAFKALLAELKQQLGGVCVVCGTSDALHFAHVDPSTKLFNVADGSNAQISFARVRVEAAKCQLKCKAHHIVETARQHRDGSIRGNKGRRKPDEPRTGIPKRCCECRETKDVVEFYRGSGSHGRQSHCKICNIAVTATRIATNKEYVNAYKAMRCCVDCDSKEGLEFDHVRGIKFKEVSKMMSYSRQRLDAEIAKCDLRCPAHHKNVTHSRKADVAER